MSARLLLPVGLLLLTACSGGTQAAVGGGGTPSDSASDLVSEAPTNAASILLTTYLLTDADFPEDWSGAPADPGGTALRTADPGCSTSPPGTEPTASAAAVFSHSTEGVTDESLSEDLDSFGSAADVTSALNGEKTYLASCTTLIFDGTSLRVRQLGLARAGDDTTSVQLTGFVNEDPIVIDLAYARRGTVLVRVAHVATPPISSSFTSTELTAAVKHIPA